jgi:hypothetical protein
MKRHILPCLIAALVASVAALAADVTGTWVAQVPGPGGNTLETTFNFKVAGEKLTGTRSNQYGDREISDGKVAGDDISFTVNIDFGGNTMTLLFKGKASGNEIKMTQERKGGGDFPGPATVEFVAKKK